MTPEDIAYLRAQAQTKGYNADDLLKAIQYESSGRPTVWGGKGGDYFGLIQFGPNERKAYGIDTAHPNARNQIDGMFRFLGDRGYRPDMGMLDLYSTINAGSPGHYKASDGNGTVASHVAKMMGQSLPAGMTLSGPSDVGALAYTGSSAQPSSTTPKADPIGELLAMQPAAKKEDPIAGLLSSMQQQPQQQKSSMDDDFVRQMMDFHSAQHQRAIQGLL
jgi:hypothetical protein